MTDAHHPPRRYLETPPVDGAARYRNSEGELTSIQTCLESPYEHLIGQPVLGIHDDDTPVVAITLLDEGLARWLIQQCVGRFPLDDGDLETIRDRALSDPGPRVSGDVLSLLAELVVKREGLKPLRPAHLAKMRERAERAKNASAGSVDSFPAADALILLDEVERLEAQPRVVSGADDPEGVIAVQEPTGQIRYYKRFRVVVGIDPAGGSDESVMMAKYDDGSVEVLPFPEGSTPEEQARKFAEALESNDVTEGEIVERWNGPSTPFGSQPHERDGIYPSETPDA